MSENGELAAALERAVTAAPDDAPLRLHVASALLDSGDPARALEHVVAALTLEPADPRAAYLAARAATAAGDPRADAYARLAAALDGGMNGGSVVPASAASTRNGDVTEAASATEDDRAFLEIVRGSLGGSVDAGPVEGAVAAHLWSAEERPTLTLSDVAGMDDAKRRLQVSFLGPLRSPEILKAYRKTLRGGLLLYGPPGCGKAFIARATAGELRSAFLPIGLAEDPSEAVALSDGGLHQLFDRARRNAPCVLFFEDIDALGPARGRSSSAAGRGAMKRFLTELEGADAAENGVFVLASTSQPWAVDPSLRRAGRFDRTVLVLPPDEPARVAILAYQLRERPTDDLDLGLIAARTDGFSSADLVQLCESAVERALNDAIESGDTRAVHQEDLVAAFSALQPSTRPWFEIAKNYAGFANASGEYDDLLGYVRARGL